MSDCGDPEHDEARLREEWERHFARCPTCGLTNDDLSSINCSNCWHLTGEDRIPEPRPYVPGDRGET